MPNTNEKLFFICVWDLHFKLTNIYIFEMIKAVSSFENINSKNKSKHQIQTNNHGFGKFLITIRYGYS